MALCAWVNYVPKLETRTDEGRETCMHGQCSSAGMVKPGLPLLEQKNLVCMLILLCVDWETSIPKETSFSWS